VVPEYRYYDHRQQFSATMASSSSSPSSPPTSPQGFTPQIASPVPPPPAQDPVTPAQWAILAAIADTFAPSITKAAGNPLLQRRVSAEVYDTVSRRIEELAQEDGRDGLVAEFLDERASAAPEFKEYMMRVLGVYLDSATKAQFLTLLSVLS
jgi:hypothetical protein